MDPATVAQTEGTSRPSTSWARGTILAAQTEGTSRPSTSWARGTILAAQTEKTSHASSGREQHILAVAQTVSSSLGSASKTESSATSAQTRMTHPFKSVKELLLPSPVCSIIRSESEHEKAVLSLRPHHIERNSLKRGRKWQERNLMVIHGSVGNEGER